MHVSTYIHTFQVDDTQQGADHVRKQDKQRELFMLSMPVTHAAKHSSTWNTTSSDKLSTTFLLCESNIQHAHI